MTSRTPDRPPYARRLALVRAAAADAGLDALLVTHPPNLRYLTGFEGSLGALLITADRCTLIVDGRYITAARSGVEASSEPAAITVQLADRSQEEAVAALVLATSARTLGIEAGVTTISRLERLERAVRRGAGEEPAPVRLVPVERTVEQARLVKDATEIATLRTAARMLSDVARNIIGCVRIGQSEREIAAAVDAALRKAGFERPAFETIVASGPNSALPHARPGTRTLAPGDGVVLDFGGVYDGYCVDLTRTVQMAPLTDAFGEIFEAVRAAHGAAVAAVRPGVPASAVDTAAREALARRGLAGAFLHGTGHGLGLEVHEEPRISKAGTANPDETLRPGMVFTIEPGAYVAGLGGVRLEDDVLVVDQGCELLTDVPIGR